jgi:hypothetical protein
VELGEKPAATSLLDGIVGDDPGLAGQPGVHAPGQPVDGGERGEGERDRPAGGVERSGGVELVADVAGRPRVAPQHDRFAVEPGQPVAVVALGRELLLDADSELFDDGEWGFDGGHSRASARRL